MANVRPMGNNAEIAEHGTIFQGLLLAPEDTNGLEGVVEAHQGVEEQYKYAALQAQREHQRQWLMSRLWMVTKRLEQ